MKFVLSGGGTAGHINPALALAEILQEQGHEVYFAGTPQGVEARLVPEAGISFTSFVATGFNRSRPLSLVSALRNMQKSTKAAQAWLEDIMPDAVVCFGGYVCIPVGRAAHKLSIPLVIHEQNSVMGLANKYLAKVADAVALTYEEAGMVLRRQEKNVVTGNPVRNTVLKATREEGRALLGIDNDKLVLLIFGGSLGARHINSAVVALKEKILSRSNVVVVHVSGPKEYDAVRNSLQLSKGEETRWKLFDYQDRMGDVLAATDVVLSRAGATSLAEISARRIPALLVPFPFATEDHQTTNARSYVERGAAYMVADADLDSLEFEEQLFSLIDDQGIRDEMHQAAAGFATEGAANRLADVVIGVTHS